MSRPLNKNCAWSYFYNGNEESGYGAILPEAGRRSLKMERLWFLPGLMGAEQVAINTAERCLIGITPLEISTLWRLLDDYTC